jgi:hypothetical protein
MKAPLPQFSWSKKFAVAALTLATMSPWSLAQSSRLIFDSGDEIDTVTFDPAKISDAKLHELILLSPYIVTYFDQLPARDIGVAGSTEDLVVDKSFLSLKLELCISAEVVYVHCEANTVSGPNFVRNAEVNVKKSKRGLAWLQNLVTPKELAPVMKFLMEGLEFSIETEETRLRYYTTWDENVLKEAHDGIEPAEHCSEAFHKLDGATSEEEKYGLVAHDWANCVNRAIQQKLGKYPVASWNAFLRTYGIKETFKEIGPPD